jgi:hypothetical protein
MSENKERRGRPKTEVVETPRKFKRVYEYEESTVTWIYNLDITDRGPIEVDVKYKPNINIEKYWRDKAKQAKEDRRISREMRKINERNVSKKVINKVKPKKNK